MSHSDSYDDGSTFTHASAATVAARRTAAPPVSVRKNSRSGVWTLLAHAVRPENAGGWVSLATGAAERPLAELAVDADLVERLLQGGELPLAEVSDEQLGDGAQVHRSSLGQAGNSRVRQGDDHAAPVRI